MRLSTGLRNHILASGSFKNGLDGGVIRIYSGTPPATADDAVPAASTLLCTLTVDGDGSTGLNFDTAAAAGLLQKATSEVWQGTNVATGNAAWFRFEPQADGGGQSTTALRLQGTVGVAGADLNISSVALTTGAVQTVDFFSVLLPAA